MPDTQQLTAKTRAFCIPNHVSNVITDVTEPWAPDQQKPIPDFGTKAQYRKWCALSTTNHNFFSMIEGENPSARVNGDNKPFRVHGIVADFDADVTDEELAAGLTRQNFEYPIYAYNRTFSNGVRVVWRFEEPIFFYSRDNYKRLVARLRRELQIGDICPGLDEEALFDAHKTYAGGDNWKVLGGIIRAAAVHLWSQEVSEREEWSDYGRARIPLDQVKAEIDNKWGEHAWEGDFALGSRGVRFWEGGTAKSVIVRETGLTCFTGDKPFITWDDLLGKAFVQKFMESRAGAALRDMHFDGRNYWRKLVEGSWCPLPTEMARRHLQVQYGLEAKIPKGENFSEVDSVLHRLETTKYIAAALPFPCNPNELVLIDGVPHLNISNVRVIQPASESKEWGEGFSFVSGYLSQLFLHDNSLVHILAWMRHAYLGALRGDPSRGHALFIAGPTGTGKTLFSRCIMGNIFGGCRDASACLVDGDKYSDRLFESFIWAIDDSYAANDPRAHARYSTAIKAVVANPTARYAKKYGAETDIPFNGRLVVTMNDDALSLEMLPNIEASLQDKLLLVRTGSDPVDLPARWGALDVLVKGELPNFLRWLIDWEPPVDIVGEPDRFGYAAHQDEQLIEDAREESSIGIISELVQTFKAIYKLGHKESLEWTGTTTELLSLMASYPETQYCCPKNPTVLGRQLRQSMGQGLKGLNRKSVRFGTEVRKCWVIEL